MSSLSTIKQELVELDELLATEVEELVKCEELLADAQSTVKTIQRHRARLSRALAILNGDVDPLSTKVHDEEPVQAAVEAQGGAIASLPATPVAPPSPPSQPRPSNAFRVPCSACAQGSMYEMIKTARTGAVIRYMGCNSCGNEAY